MVCCLSAGRKDPLFSSFPDLAYALHRPLQQNKRSFETMEIKALALHENALRVRAHRNEVLASNIANADTPNYKARDLDFAAALKGARNQTISLTKTSDMHQEAWGTSRSVGKLMYRVPVQPTLDGNTVEADVEQAKFSENAVQYRASLAFLDGQIRSLKFAIKGGD